MAASVPLDPRLFDSAQPPDPVIALPSRNLDNAEDASDEEGQDGSGKRRKLNLLKCKQCRDARKKVRSHHVTCCR